MKFLFYWKDMSFLSPVEINGREQNVAWRSERETIGFIQLANFIFIDKQDLIQKIIKWSRKARSYSVATFGVTNKTIIL